jgi:ABC-type nickel/cobalt efflux system permease component RcnA
MNSSLGQDDPEFKYYQPSARTRDYSRPPTQEELTHDLNKAHDNIKHLVRDNDRLHKNQHWQRIWTKILSAGVVGSWAVILMLLKLCLHG